MRRKIAVGNWKMNGCAADFEQIALLQADHHNSNVDILICPPAPYIQSYSAQASPIKIGAQDCHASTNGAHTGDLSAQMLCDVGASYVIVGHSERRADHSESNELVAQKAKTAHDAGLIAIVCIGETLDERNLGITLDVLSTQLTNSLPKTATSHNTIIAYEPVWAIGTGKIPSAEQIGDVHAYIRAYLCANFTDGQESLLLYGGSVKGSNATDIFAISDVDGALVGGASLKAEDFSPIIQALQLA